jgi:hypothetical protein
LDGAAINRQAGITLEASQARQVSLKWERSKGTVEILVIDHAASPAPN